MVNKFKSAQNNWLVQALFHEGLTRSEIKPLYYLDDVRKEYLKLGDLTGVKLANKMFGGWQHFQHMLNTTWFKEHFDMWYEELVTMKVAEHLEKIEQIAREDTAQAFQAAKFLVTKEYMESPTKRGRPSKDEITGNLKQEVRKLDAAKQDLQRMKGSLTLIQGGKN